jgi:hypothetical protein
MFAGVRLEQPTAGLSYIELIHKENPAAELYQVAPKEHKFPVSAEHKSDVGWDVYWASFFLGRFFNPQSQWPRQRMIICTMHDQR